MLAIALLPRAAELLMNEWLLFVPVIPRCICLLRLLAVCLLAGCLQPLYISLSCTPSRLLALVRDHHHHMDTQIVGKYQSCMVFIFVARTLDGPHDLPARA